MSDKLGRLNAQYIMNSIIKWGSYIIFGAAAIVMAYLSFVDSFSINPSVRNITSIALVALVLNVIVWDTVYKGKYNDVLNADIVNEQYSIHRRYYFAHKGWTHKELQKTIRNYNNDVRDAWLEDIKDITGRSIEEIVNEPYKGQSHKWLVFRVKHRMYPKTGLRTPKDMLYVLSVGKSDSMKIKVKGSESFHKIQFLKKIVSSALGATLAGTLTYSFIADGWESAALKLLLNIGLLIMSFFFGSMSGLKGGQIKLAVAEEVCEKLEEWKNVLPKEVPYKDKAIVVDTKPEVVQKTNVIELV